MAQADNETGLLPWQNCSMLATAFFFLGIIGALVLIAAVGRLLIQNRAGRHAAHPILHLNKHPHDITNLVYNPRAVRRSR